MNIPASVSLIILLFFASFTGLRAQHIVKGKVNDGAQQPVPFAVLSILDAHDSAVVQSVFPDTAGRYQFELADLKDKLVKVACVGYIEETREITNIDAALQAIDFTLRENKTALNEVVVEAAKPLLERKPDRIVFNVTASVAALGSNALDVLRKAPGVWVRQQDNTINLVGKSAVQVLINDRLQQLSGEDLIALLQAIPSEQIERVEVITTPPAKYEASGNSGLIRIVLKKNNKQGFNGSARAGYEQASYAKAIGGADVNSRKGKLNLYGNGSYSNGSNAVAERLQTPYAEQVFRVEDRYKKTLRPLQYQLGADYELHTNGTVGLQFTGNVADRTGDDNTSIRVLRLPALVQDSTIRTLGSSTMKNGTNILNANYVWTMDTAGSKLTVNANRLWFDGRRSNDFHTTHYLDDFETPTGNNSRNKTEGRQHIRITTVQADVELPYRWLSLSLGGKLNFIDNRSNNTFRYWDGEQYREDLSISNAFDYSEKVQALYVSASKSWNRWSFQAGLRGEFTQTSGYSLNLNQTTRNRYFNLFPTAYLQYQPNDKHAWTLNYSRRINRPDYRSLDPYRAYATPYHYGQGNPFLLPSFNNNLELSYTFNSRYTFSAFYQYEQNHFGSVWMIDPVRNITSGLSKNFADFVAYGLNASAGLQPLPCWEMQAQLSLQMQELRSGEYTAIQQSYRLPLYYASSSNSFTLNKDRTWIAEASFFYLGKYREDFLEIDPIGSIDLGLRTLFLDKKLVVGLNVTDMLATQRGRGVHVVTRQRIDNYFDTRNIRLSVTYKFGNHKIKGKRERSTGIEEEKGRAG